jgi:hypothetical protein
VGKTDSLDGELLSDVDREALERALDMVRQESPAQRKQIDDMVVERGWDKAAGFAVYCCQDNRLKLAPWQMPPCWIRGNLDALLAAPVADHDYRGQRQAALLLRRLLAAGLSKYEPDPLVALARAEGKVKAKRDRPAPGDTDPRGASRARDPPQGLRKEPYQSSALSNLRRR